MYRAIHVSKPKARMMFPAMLLFDGKTGEIPMFYKITIPAASGLRNGPKSLMINLDHVAAIGDALFPVEGRPYGVWMLGRDVLGQVENFTVTPTEYQEICDSLPVVAWRDGQDEEVPSFSPTAWPRLDPTDGSPI